MCVFDLARACKPPNTRGNMHTRTHTACAHAQDTRGIVEIAVKLTMRNERLPLSEVLGGERCPPKLERLLAQCWDADPKRRPAVSGGGGGGEGGRGGGSGVVDTSPN